MRGGARHIVLVHLVHLATLTTSVQLIRRTSVLPSAIDRSHVCRCCSRTPLSPLLLAANESSSISEASVGALRFYKQVISPLMPPACRFIPTCSEYGQQAFERFSPAKATVLTAWRLTRCNPLHTPGCGFGVDEPQWPPPAYWAGSGRLRTYVDDDISRRRANGEDVDAVLPNGDPLGLYGDDADKTSTGEG